MNSKEQRPHPKDNAGTRERTGIVMQRSPRERESEREKGGERERERERRVNTAPCSCSSAFLCLLLLSLQKYLKTREWQRGL